MVKVVFTRNKTLGSWLIRQVTKEDVSHCAIMYNDTVLHSTSKYGVHFTSRKNFLAKNQVIRSAYLKNRKSLIRVAGENAGKGYDYLAFLQLALRYLFPSLTPKVSLWEISGMFLCTELISETVLPDNERLLTPHQLYKELKRYG